MLVREMSVSTQASCRCLRVCRSCLTADCSRLQKRPAQAIGVPVLDAAPPGHSKPAAGSSPSPPPDPSDNGNGTEEEWPEGLAQLNLLKQQARQSSTRGLLHWHARRLAEAEEAETLPGLQHLAIYKSYRFSVPDGMTVGGAVEASRFHLLKAVELRCEGGLEALVEEVEGRSQVALVGGIVMMLMGLAVLVAMLLAVL